MNILLFSPLQIIFDEENTIRLHQNIGIFIHHGLLELSIISFYTFGIL